MVTGSRSGSARSSERSEEHTSELQSQSNLVCRLLRAKKKLSRYTSTGNAIAVTIDPGIDNPRASQYRRKSASSRSCSCVAGVIPRILQVQGLFCALSL